MKFNFSFDLIKVLLCLKLAALTSGCASQQIVNDREKKYLTGYAIMPVEANPKQSNELSSPIESSNCVMPPQENEMEKKDNWREMNLSASNCWKNRDYKKLAKWAKYLIENFNQSPWGFYYLSEVKRSEKNHVYSLWLIDQAIAKAPRTKILIFQKARLLWSAKRPMEAYDLVRSIEFSGADEIYLARELQLFIARIALFDGDKETAKANIETVLKQFPKDKEAIYLSQKLNGESAEVVVKQANALGAK